MSSDWTKNVREDIFNPWIAFVYLFASPFFPVGPMRKLFLGYVTCLVWGQSDPTCSLISFQIIFLSILSVCHLIFVSSESWHMLSLCKVYFPSLNCLYSMSMLWVEIYIKQALEKQGFIQSIRMLVPNITVLRSNPDHGE